MANYQYDVQYRPISNSECLIDGAGDYSNPASVRLVRDASTNINNMLKRVVNYKLSSEQFVPTLKSVSLSTDNTPLIWLGCYHIPHSHPSVIWYTNTRLISGSGQVDWTLYCLSYQYFVDGSIDTSSMSTIRATTTTNTVLNAWTPTYCTLDLPSGRDDWDWHFVISAQNSDLTTRGEMVTSDIQLRFPFTRPSTKLA
jgi:hypothetical protein